MKTSAQQEHQTEFGWCPPPKGTVVRLWMERGRGGGREEERKERPQEERRKEDARCRKVERRRKKRGKRQLGDLRTSCHLLWHGFSLVPETQAMSGPIRDGSAMVTAT